MTNKEKFSTLVSKEKTETLNRNKERIKNRSMLRESQRIALKVLLKLDELGWTQRDLAEKLEVSPQQINKIVSGKENLTIETQIKLQDTLEIPVLASYYENKMNTVQEWILTIEKRVEKIVMQSNQIHTHYQSFKTVKMEKQAYTQKYYPLAV